MKSSLKRFLDAIFGGSVRGRENEERVKFFIRWNVLGFFGRTLVFLFGARVNKKSWEERILIIGPGGIGDVIMATPAVRYYREYFSGKKIYMLVTEHGGMTRAMFGDLIDEVLTVNGQRFEASPWYKLQLINQLRAVGFKTVINEAMGAKDITSKSIAVSLGAASVTGYEGPGVELANPVAAPFRQFAVKHINSHYTSFIKSIDEDFEKMKSHPKSAILHHLAICQAVTGRTSFPDVSTVFHVDQASIDSARAKLATLGASGKKYVAFVIACVDPGRRWELEKFAEVARHVHEQGFEVLIIGTRAQKIWSDELRAAVNFPIIDTAGEVSLLESAAVIRDAYCMVANDTGPVHIAVALGVPLICIPTGGHLAMNSLYGREEINRWVYKDIGCLYDDARCVATVPVGDPAPCVAAVQASDVIREFDALQKYLAAHPIRNEAFVAEFKNTPNYHENIH